MYTFQDCDIIQPSDSENTQMRQTSNGNRRDLRDEKEEKWGPLVDTTPEQSDSSLEPIPVKRSHHKNKKTPKKVIS